MAAESAATREGWSLNPSLLVREFTPLPRTHPGVPSVTRVQGQVVLVTVVIEQIMVPKSIDSSLKVQERVHLRKRMPERLLSEYVLYIVFELF